ncbi:DUF3572 domain-containing protein [Sphingomonas donggukensis]|uniref:DUF3572 domain-containing protein n=1 Tax=Sphingomonas donggukensis TaxID=2949093 RepID=A0ABY4TVQ0_9SPHN|nr:DUF3572 family protein [Sphingomonas donggukensis]URW75796.1 DUF3572 domain-containing protein [Sphingomonas donggukensis]
MPRDDTNADGAPDDSTLALRALVWTLAEPQRAMRLLDTTGLAPADLRSSASAPATLVALLTFLEAHEPDLIACAEGIGTTPAALVATRERLEAA